MKNGTWLSTDVQSQIEPPPIPLIKSELEEQKATKFIKVNIRRTPSQDMSETYKVNIFTFDDGQLE